MMRTGTAAARAMARACARPTERGLDPTRTNETPVMMSAATSSDHHQRSTKIVASESVTRTAAVVSATMRMKLAALRCAPMSAAMACNERRARERSASSPRSPRLSTLSAASAAARNPPKATSSTEIATNARTTTTSGVRRGRSR